MTSCLICLVFIVLSCTYAYEHHSHRFDNNHVESSDANEVNIDDWNALNDQDMQHMPVINDYTNEFIAIDWLKWYFRLSERYFQVRMKNVRCQSRIDRLIVNYLDQCHTRLELRYKHN
jgi:hypothetical protein